ncbi:MAG: hypothetical protein NTV97_08830 [Alphaproteobacteria bacterium]|nr:hypothetical protein [Alphaproteobacteria bacterium]
MSKSRKTRHDVIDAAEMAEVQRVALAAAKAGNMPGAAIVERMWRRRRQTVAIDLPPLDDAKGIAAAQSAVIAAVAAEKITPRDGLVYARLLEYRRRALETVEYEASLAEIEEANAERAEQEKARRR